MIPKGNPRQKVLDAAILPTAGVFIPVFRLDLFTIFPLTIPVKKKDIVVITKESSFSENKISEMWCGVPLYLIE